VELPAGLPGEPVIDSAAAGIIRGESWILGQPSGNYTVQLLSVADPTNLHKFIERHQLGDSVACYRDKRVDPGVYILVYGSYPDKRAALRAIGNLPNAVRGNGPWPRRLDGVQNTIIEHRHLTTN
jgi:septal ring-binding cell division protein DamX